MVLRYGAWGFSFFGLFCMPGWFSTTPCGSYSLGRLRLILVYKVLRRFVYVFLLFTLWLFLFNLCIHQSFHWRICLRFFFNIHIIEAFIRESTAVSSLAFVLPQLLLKNLPCFFFFTIRYNNLKTPSLFSSNLQAFSLQHFFSFFPEQNRQIGGWASLIQQQLLGTASVRCPQVGLLTVWPRGCRKVSGPLAAAEERLFDIMICVCILFDSITNSVFS